MDQPPDLIPVPSEAQRISINSKADPSRKSSEKTVCSDGQGPWAPPFLLGNRVIYTQICDGMPCFPYV